MMKRKQSVKVSCLSVSLLLALCLPLTGCANRSTPTETASSFSVPDNSFLPESFPRFSSDVISHHDTSHPSSSSVVSEPITESHDEPSVSVSLVSEPTEESDTSVSTVSEPEHSHTASSSQDSSEVSQEASAAHPYDPMEDASTIESLEDKYFVNALEDDSLKHFARLYHGAADFSDKVTFSEPIPSSLLDDMMFLLNYDCPELIHVSGDYMPYYSDDYGEMVSGVRFTYTMTQEEYASAREELQVFRKQLLTDTDHMNDSDKEQYVYRLLFDQVIFDDYSRHAGSIYGALVEHRGRCEGISKAFAWCLQQCGMECLTVAGVPLWENTGAYAGHSWNIVRLEDTYYHVDIAADNMRNRETDPLVPLYGFLNSSDTQMAHTHRINDIFVRLGVPSCPSDRMNYHIMQGQYIDSSDDLHSRFDLILHNRYSPGENTQISIRFGTEETYRTFIDCWENDWETFRTTEDYPPCSSHIYYNDVSLTAAIVLTQKPETV